MTPATFASRLVAARQRLNLSQTEAATLCGVCRITFHRWEHPRSAVRTTPPTMEGVLHRLTIAELTAPVAALAAFDKASHGVDWKTLTESERQKWQARLERADEIIDILTK